MSIPSYTFLQKNAAKLDEPKRFVDTLISSGKFGRDEHGYVQFRLADGPLIVQSKSMLREILLSGETVALGGDINDQAAFDCLWSWFAARRWTFPRLNAERPYNPPKPLPIRGTRYVSPVLGGKR